VQLPVPAEPLVALGLGLTALVVLGALPVLAYWAAREAAARDGSPTFTLVYLLTGVGVVHYAYVRFVRADLGARDASPGRRERLAAAYVLAVAVAFLAAVVVSPPDPVTQVLTFPPLFAVTLTGAVLLVTRGPSGGESEATA
jgi:sec-independent protein translocase protein TatC